MNAETMLYAVYGTLGVILVWAWGFVAGSQEMQVRILTILTKKPWGFYATQGADGKFRKHKAVMIRDGDIQAKDARYGVPNEAYSIDGCPTVFFPENNAISGKIDLSKALKIEMTNDELAKNSAFRLDILGRRISALEKMKVVEQFIKQILNNLTIAQFLAGGAIIAIIIVGVWVTKSIDGAKAACMSCESILTNQTSLLIQKITLPGVI